MLQAACQQFLGKSEEHIRQIALETLEGHQRAIMGNMTVEVRCQAVWILLSINIFKTWQHIHGVWVIPLILSVARRHRTSSVWFDKRPGLRPLLRRASHIRPPPTGLHADAGVGDLSTLTLSMHICWRQYCVTPVIQQLGWRRPHSVLRLHCQPTIWWSPSSNKVCSVSSPNVVRVVR